MSDSNAEKLDKIQNDLNWIIRYLLQRDALNQPPPFVPPHPPYKYDPPVWPGPTLSKKTCSKCGMSLDGVMGYVCGDNNCPTFLKVTC
jgi:hypothetical protein